MEYLFVYGTLRHCIHHRNGQLLMEQATYLGKAMVSGRLYDIDRYPGLVLAPGSGLRVVGDLFRLPHPANLLRILDEYEECAPGYARPQEYRRGVAERLCANQPPHHTPVTSCTPECVFI